MKHRKLLSMSLAALIACTGTAGLSFSASQNVQTAAAVDDTGDDWLHAKGSRLYDSAGNEVWLTGANWFGMNCSENAPHGLYAQQADPFLSNVADAGINIIRFPVSSELLISWMNGEPLKVSSVQCWGDESNGFNIEFLEADGKTTKNSLEIFEILVKKLKKYGLKCFIDVHSPHSDNSGHDWPLWYGKAGVTTKSWIDSLVWTADHFKNDDTILGYDLENEPHGKGQDGVKSAKWDGSTDENNWAYAATQCANAILKVHPHALIFVEGVEQSLKDPKTGTWGMPDSLTNSPYYGAWWGGNFRGVKDYPIVPDSGTSQIVYSPHDYGPSVYAQTWFEKDFTEETLLDDYWRDTWAFIGEQEIGPLLIGEWGGHMDKGKNEKWMKLLRDYMIKNHINHTFWCLNPNSGDTGGLLDTQFKNWDKDKYGLFEPSLWKTESGKYIGLDHQTPLGKNGISLNEFYSTTQNSNLDGGKSNKGGNVIIVDKTTPSNTTTTTKATTTTTKTTTTTTKTTTTTTKTTTTTTNTTTISSDDPSSGKGNIIYGDVNNDKIVDIKDAVMLARAVGGDINSGITDLGMINAEITGDKKVNSEDLKKLLRFLAKLDPDIAPPEK